MIPDNTLNCSVLRDRGRYGDEHLEDSDVDAYLAGHDHRLQHLLPEGGGYYLISGSASACGFLLLSLSSEEIIVMAYLIQAKCFIAHPYKSKFVVHRKNKVE